MQVCVRFWESAVERAAGAEEHGGRKKTAI